MLDVFANSHFTSFGLELQGYGFFVKKYLSSALRPCNETALVKVLAIGTQSSKHSKIGG